VLFGLSMDYEVLLLSRTHENSSARTTTIAPWWPRSPPRAGSSPAPRSSWPPSSSASAPRARHDQGDGHRHGDRDRDGRHGDPRAARAATMRLLGDWNWWAPGPLKRCGSASGCRPRAVARALFPVAARQRGRETEADVDRARNPASREGQAAPRAQPRRGRAGRQRVETSVTVPSATNTTPRHTICAGRGRRAPRRAPRGGPGQRARDDTQDGRSGVSNSTSAAATNKPRLDGSGSATSTCAAIFAKRLTMGSRQSRPKARGVILTPIGPAAACTRPRRSCGRPCGRSRARSPGR